MLSNVSRSLLGERAATVFRQSGHLFIHSFPSALTLPSFLQQMLIEFYCVKKRYSLAHRLPHGKHSINGIVVIIQGTKLISWGVYEDESDSELIFTKFVLLG